MAPVRLNTKNADRTFWLSLFLSVLFNAALMAALARPHAGLRQHIFFLMASDERRLQMHVGSPYSVLPAAPRFAAAAVVGEDRFDPERFRLDEARDAPPPAGPNVPAPIRTDPAEHRPLAAAGEHETARRANGPTWDRESPLDDPAIRLSPEADAAPPIRGVRPPAPAIIEERFNPSGYAPVLERSRPGALEPSIPSAVAVGDDGLGPIGEDAGIESELIRATPVRARLAVMESPGVYVPVETLEPDAPAMRGHGRFVWLVEEKRFDPALASAMTDGDREPEMRVERERREHSPLLIATPALPGEPSNAELPGGSLSRRVPFRALMKDAPPEPERPAPEPQPRLDPKPKAPEPPKPPPAEPKTESEAQPTDRSAELASGEAPSIDEGFAVMYPERSRRRGETGTVIVESRLDADGRARSARLAQSSGFPALDAAALEAVRGARFRRGGEARGFEERAERHVIVFKLN